MKSNNLLVISNDFPNADNKYVREIFVKEQIMFLKEYFENIYVVSPIAIGMEFLRKTHYENYRFENIHVYFPKYFNCPLFFKYCRDGWIYFEEKAIQKLIRAESLQFDLIHAHFTWHSGAVAVKVKEKYNVPLVITEHTSQTFTDAIEKKETQFIRSWNLCDAIIRVRKGDIPLFERVGIPLDKVYYIPNGYSHKSFLNLDSQNSRKQLGLPLNIKIILNVGNLYDEAKGHKYLIEAMNIVIKQRKDVLCFIVGGGILETKLKKQILSTGLEDYIKLVGSKPYTEIPLWMNACDVFVLPSLSEGNPTVMFECLGCGKPFVGTKVGGVPEIIVSDDYGLLSEPGDPNELAKNILSSLDTSWDTKKIKEYSIQFTWGVVGKKILKVYSKIGATSLRLCVD